MLAYLSLLPILRESLVAYLTDAITVAENIERHLKKGIRELATKILYPIPGIKNRIRTL